MISVVATNCIVVPVVACGPPTKDLPEGRSLVAGCHNAAFMLGSSEQAKGALFYIANYVAKSKVALEQCFTVLNQVTNHVKKHPSNADDSGTTRRTSMHVLQRTLNRLNLLMEVSDYQVAAALIGLPTEITTGIFTYFSP